MNHPSDWNTRVSAQLLTQVRRFAVIALLGACSLAEHHRPISVIHINGDSIGPLRVGLTRSQMTKIASVIRDTVEEGIEAIPESIAVVLVGGDTVRAVIDSGRAYNLTVSSARFRTVDSLGPGVPLAAVLQKRGVYALTGEGAVFVHVPHHCGLSFWLTESGTLADRPDSVGAAALRTLPESTRVREVIAYGCAKGGVPPP